MPGCIRRRSIVVCFLAVLTLPQSALQAKSVEPKLRDYPVAELFEGTAAEPIIATPEARRYRTRIKTGVRLKHWVTTEKGEIFSAGPDFAGHYFVIQWGCGSQCAMMAIVDAKTGAVYPPPLNGGGNELHVPLDVMGPAKIEFARDSSLMILRNACEAARCKCGIFYFNWIGDRFKLVKKIPMDQTKQPDGTAMCPGGR